MELDSKQFIAALQGKNVERDLEGFITDHNMKLSVSEILEIAQMVCKVADVVCPLIEGL